jgi:IS30 family transposase
VIRTWRARRPGTRIKLTVEKEMLIHQLHAEGKPVAAIARMVGLTRKTVYKAIRGQEEAACECLTAGTSAVT